ncbi:MAG TPA: DUF2314 domain-containing protein, partial [Armatimonadota bacterium]|nr:DUF2314 domain-containing protein [Armatimonadota bacterium]
QAAKGVILDPDIPRLLSMQTHTERLPADGRLRISEQIILPTSVGERGLAWMTSKGLGRFGLPELEIRDAPPNLDRTIWPVLNGVAYRLLSEAAQARASDEKAGELQVGPEIRVTLEDIARAEGEPPARPPDGVRGWTDIRLEYHPSRQQDSFLRLVPPRGFRGGQGEWLHGLLGDLFGTEDTLTHIPAGDEAMEIAHRRALDELPHVRQRFGAGLPVGCTLYVKQAFPVQGGSPEYMWLAVNTWGGSRIRAQLANDPQYRLDLRAGQTLELDEADVYDWMISWKDGRLEGGYTTEVLRRRGAG